MNKNKDVAERALELSKTIGEGLFEVGQFVGNGDFNKGMIVFGDVFNALNSIEEALNPFIEQLGDNHMKETLKSISKEGNKLMDLYEEGERESFTESLENDFIPLYKKFADELEKALESYLV